MNALVYVDIDQGIQKEKIKWHEMKNEKNYVGFHMIKYGKFSYLTNFVRSGTSQVGKGFFFHFLPKKFFAMLGRIFFKVVPERLQYAPF